MIPKKIHYCWFGRNSKPKMAEKCIKSWKRYCPDYEIIEWNEDNFDISATPLYVRQAYEAKKWAFVTDYVRLQVVYVYGGIYLDTDVELKKNLDFLLNNNAYFGFESTARIATGLGFGAEKGSHILWDMMVDYHGIPFLLEGGTYDLTPCPQRNTEVFLRYGLQLNNSVQMLEGNILILSTEYLCPIDYETKIKKFTSQTVSVHWFDASWKSEEERMREDEDARELRRKLQIETLKGNVKKIIGEKGYRILKKVLKRGYNQDGED